MAPQQTNTTDTRQQVKTAAAPPVMPFSRTSDASVTEEEKRAKDMLNNIWNSLKVPQVTGSAPTAVQAPPQVDLAEALKKCLKINPSAATAPSAIQQPAPAQLPPPPANWRIEAQIQHLSQVRPPAQVPQPAQPMPNMMHALPGPPPPMFQMAPVYMGPNQRFPAPHPPPHMGYPPHIFPPSSGPVVMSGFRPVAAMPFTRGAGPPPPRGMMFHRQQERDTNRVSGPNALRNTGTVGATGHGAFIPLQAARKITKLKNLNGGGPAPEKTVAPVVEQSKPIAVAEASTSKPEMKNKEPKQVPLNKSKPNAAPRPARIAANFSVKE